MSRVVVDACRPCVDPLAFKLLVNLALRCRHARADWARMKTAKTLPPSAIEHAHGAALEAWNTFQAAKRIAGRG